MTTDHDEAAFIPYRNVPTAPFIYFDFAAAYGVVNGVIEIELTARCLIPDPSERLPTTEIVPVARLRCSVTAMASLQETTTKLTELLKRAQQQGALSISATGKMN